MFHQLKSAKLKLDKFNKVRRNLIQAIASIFEESLCDRFVNKYDAKLCEFHKVLISWLKKRDAIISFNYDCLVDRHLKNFGSDKWNARYGYGLPAGPWRYTGVDCWNAERPSSKSETIMLLKLHGSMNWQVDENEEAIHLKDRPYTRQHGEMRFSIIPPEAHKVVEQPYAQLWKSAARVLRDTDHLVFIGFSFVATDLEAMSLFHLMTNRKLRSLTIVNPDRIARQRTKQILIKSILPTTQVIVFDSFQDYVNYLNYNMTKLPRRKRRRKGSN